MEEKICKNCEYKNSPDAKFCFNCGKNLDETKEFLQKYETIGLKFNLTELEKYSEDFSNKRIQELYIFVNEKC